MKTATEAINSFFTAWKNADYQAMHDSCTHTYREEHPVTELQTLFEDMQLISFAIYPPVKGNEKIHATDFKVKAKVKGRALNQVKKVTMPKVRTVPELAAFRNDINGDFGVNPISLLNN